MRALAVLALLAHSGELGEEQGMGGQLRGNTALLCAVAVKLSHFSCVCAPRSGAAPACAWGILEVGPFQGEKAPAAVLEAVGGCRAGRT